jgi:cation transport ATPase
MKNWQLFFISFILPWILSFSYLFFVDLETFEAGEKLMGAITVMYYSVFFAWNYKVVKAFNKNSDALTKKQEKSLDWLIVVLIIYVLYVTSHINKFFPDSVIISILLWILIIAASYAFFYIVFCTAKTLKYSQLKNQLRTSDIIVEMFVIFYFPVGVWWLQRKVNRYYNEIKTTNR